MKSDKAIGAAKHFQRYIDLGHDCFAGNVFDVTAQRVCSAQRLFLVLDWVAMDVADDGQILRIRFDADAFETPVK